MTVDLLFTDAAELLSILAKEAEPLIERKLLLSLIHDLLETVVLHILIDVDLNVQLFRCVVVTTTELWQVAELGQK